MILPLSHRMLIVAQLLALGCGGSPAPSPAEAPREDGTAAPGRGRAPADDVLPAAAEIAVDRVPDQGSAVPTSEGDCLEFHARMIECTKAGAAGGLGPGEEARMLGEAERGCRAVVADRGNPVTDYVIGLWARCKDLPCPELEGCFLSGMSELSAPPGPYAPATP